MHEIFLCYRRSGAQTAKLFKWYLQKQKIVDVWYSDDEVFGNYKNDIPHLIADAKHIVIFLSEKFTKGFKNEFKHFNRNSVDREQTITAYEIVEVMKQIESGKNISLITVNFNGYVLDQKERKILRKLFERAKIKDPVGCVNRITQCQKNNFDPAKDREEKLFSSLIPFVAPDEWYRKRLEGDYHFADKIPTSILIGAMKGANDISPNNVRFMQNEIKPELYDELEKNNVVISGSQNDVMVSFLSCKTDHTSVQEDLTVDVIYREIEYKLFKTMLIKRNDPFYNINRRISKYTMDINDCVYEIPNAMGLAFMVITGDNQLIFSRRGTRTTVRPGQYDCTIVEGLKIQATDSDGVYSIYDNDYLEKEIRRAYREEVAVDDFGIAINIMGIVLDKEYSQWNVVGSIKTNKSFDEIACAHPTRDDTVERINIYGVSFVDSNDNKALDKIDGFLSEKQEFGIWDMALPPIHSALLNVGFTTKEISEYSWRFSQLRH